jgi:hypothetical protein
MPTYGTECALLRDSPFRQYSTQQEGKPCKNHRSVGCEQWGSRCSMCFGLTETTHLEQRKNPAPSAGFFIQMSVSRLEQLRERIESVLDELGMSDAPWACVQAVSFERKAEAPHQAVLVVWLTDQNVLEFYDENCGLFKTVSLDNEDVSVRAA